MIFIESLTFRTRATISRAHNSDETFFCQQAVANIQEWLLIKKCSLQLIRQTG